MDFEAVLIGLFVAGLLVVLGVKFMTRCVCGLDPLSLHALTLPNCHMRTTRAVRISDRHRETPLQQEARLICFGPL